VTTEKNLVWAAVQPVSDLKLEDAYYDADPASAGEAVPVTLTVTNAGDHTVNSVTISQNGKALRTEALTLRPGESAELVVSVPCPSKTTSYTFAVYETALSDDFTPSDNSQTVKLGYADVSVELAYQQIGASKALAATVTNQGVESASGTLSFFDASGNVVETSEFKNLAAGDTTVVIYSLAQDFDGRNGGDVSVSVAVDQEELYTYNNEATIHINEVTSTAGDNTGNGSGGSSGSGSGSSDKNEGNGNSAGSVDGEAKKLGTTEAAVVLSSYTLKANGNKEVKPTVTVYTASGTKLKLKKDYTVDYADDIGVGEATATVRLTAKGYTFQGGGTETSVKYQIVDKTSGVFLTAKSVTVNYGASKNDILSKAKVTLKAGSKTVTPDSVDLNIADKPEAGVYPVTVTVTYGGKTVNATILVTVKATKVSLKAVKLDSVKLADVSSKTEGVLKAEIKNAIVKQGVLSASDFDVTITSDGGVTSLNKAKSVKISYTVTLKNSSLIFSGKIPTEKTAKTTLKVTAK
jgi:hypothetical protein